MKKHENHFRIFKIDGVGVNLERFYPTKSIEEKNALRAEKGFSYDDFILLYTVECIPRKNHKLLFDILPELKKKIPNLKVILAGKGELLEFYKNYSIEHNFESFVIFTGYTKEIDYYCRIADVHISTSKQERQGLNLVEAMASGLSLIASDIRGYRDVIQNGWNGILCDLNNEKSSRR